MLKKLLIANLVYIFCADSFATLQCADKEQLKGLTQEQAIDLAYRSGPSAGNFGWEWEFDGLLFLSKDNAVGNKDILDMYGVLNQDIFKNKGPVELDSAYKHNYSGMFQITYDQTRQCRRQILITGSKKNFFTGWVNVELCDPSLKSLFAAGAQFYESKSKKMENMIMFFDFLDGLAKSGKLDQSVAEDIRNKLQTDDPDVYYAKQPNGHIAPRFSVKIKKLSFKHDAEAKTCTMTLLPSSDYSGILDPEQHVFSEDSQIRAHEMVQLQKDALKNISSIALKKDTMDPVFTESGHSQNYNFLLSHWRSADEVGLRPAVINKALNTP